VPYRVHVHLNAFENFLPDSIYETVPTSRWQTVSCSFLHVFIKNPIFITGGQSIYIYIYIYIYIERERERALSYWINIL